MQANLCLAWEVGKGWCKGWCKGWAKGLAKGWEAPQMGLELAPQGSVDLRQDHTIAALVVRCK